MSTAPLSHSVRPRLTAAQLAAMPDIGPCELIDGELHMMTPAGPEHGRIVSNLHGLLWNHVREHDLGAVFAAETGFKLFADRETVRAPDCAFVAQANLQDVPRGYYPGPPDLAIEVVSPDQQVGYVQEKIDDYLKAGAAQCWTVWPATRTVTIHRPERPPQTLRDDEPLTADDLLPRFTCPLPEIFR